MSETNPTDPPMQTVELSLTNAIDELRAKAACYGDPAMRHFLGSVAAQLAVALSIPRHAEPETTP